MLYQLINVLNLASLSPSVPYNHPSLPRRHCSVSRFDDGEDAV
jgi:hypothetical protein